MNRKILPPCRPPPRTAAATFHYVEHPKAGLWVWKWPGDQNDPRRPERWCPLPNERVGQSTAGAGEDGWRYLGPVGGRPPRVATRRPLTAPLDPQLAAQHAIVEGWLSQFAPKTRKGYRRTWTEFCHAVGEPAAMTASKQMIAKFSRQGRTAPLRRLRLAVLKSFCGYAMRAGAMTRDPTATLHHEEPAKNERRLTAITLEDLQRMIDHANLRACVIILMSALCSTTSEELSRLTWGDVSQTKTGAVLRIGGDRPRSVVIPELLLTQLQALWDAARQVGDGEQSDPLLRSRLHTALEPRSITRIVGEVGEAVGVADASPSRLRNFYAQNALATGMPIEEVQRTMGYRALKSLVGHIQALSRDAA